MKCLKVGPCFTRDKETCKEIACLHHGEVPRRMMKFVQTEDLPAYERPTLLEVNRK